MTKQKSQSDKDTVAGQTASVTVPPAEPVGGALSNTTGTVDNQSKNNDATGSGGNDSSDNSKPLTPNAPQIAQATEADISALLNAVAKIASDGGTIIPETATLEFNESIFSTGRGDDDDALLQTNKLWASEPAPVLIVTASSSRRRIGRRFPAGEPVEIPADELTDGQLKELMADPVLNLTPKSM